MLIRREVLDRIRSGSVTLQFRRWKRPTVRAGGTLTTAIGVLAIHGVEEVTSSEITDQEAHRAGVDDADTLRAALAGRAGRVYRIELSFAGPDPRLALREEVDLGPDELAELRERLDRLDRASRSGAWTLAVLRAIDREPGRVARELAAELGRETAALKRDVRKLKALGLTISLEVGYRLSPRGEVVLRTLAAGS